MKMKSAFGRQRPATFCHGAAFFSLSGDFLPRGREIRRKVLIPAMRLDAFGRDFFEERGGERFGGFPHAPSRRAPGEVQTTLGPGKSNVEKSSFFLHVGFVAEDPENESPHAMSPGLHPQSASRTNSKSSALPQLPALPSIESPISQTPPLTGMPLISYSFHFCQPVLTILVWRSAPP